METEQIEYDAFISYRHLPLDMAVACKLHELLELYKPPKNVRYSNTSRIKRVFKDINELPTTSDLDADIKKALRASRMLIIICTKSTMESKWCKAEVDYYRKINCGDNSKILTVLAEGELRDVLYPELLIKIETVLIEDEEKIIQREAEPLYTDVRATTINGSVKRLKAEFLRIAAPILGCSYDDLFRRHHKRRIRRILSFSTVMVVTMVIIAFIVGFFEIRSRNATALLHYKQGIESMERDGNYSLGMMYFADSLSLHPSNTSAQSYGLALLMQNRTWPFVSATGRGRIINGMLIMNESERANINEAEALYVSDNIILKDIKAYDKASGLLLIDGYNRHEVKEANGNTVCTINGEINFIIGEDIMVSNGCWVFKENNKVLVQGIDNGEALELKRPTAINPKCDIKYEDYVENELPISVAAYNGGKRAAVVCAGYLYFYEDNGNGFEILNTIDLASVFSNLYVQGKYLYKNVGMYIDETEKLLAVVNERSVCFVALKRMEPLFTVEQNVYTLSDIAFDTDNSRVAIGYGESSVIESKEGGCAKVFSLWGEELYNTEDIYSEAISMLCINGKTDELITYSYNSQIRIWDINSKTPYEKCNSVITGAIEQHAVFCKDYIMAVEDYYGSVHLYAAVEPVDTVIASLNDKGYPIQVTFITEENEIALTTAKDITLLDAETDRVKKNIRLGEPKFEEFLVKYKLEYQNNIMFNRQEEWLEKELLTQLSKDVFMQNDFYIRQGKLCKKFIVSKDAKSLYVIGNSIPYFAAYDIDYSNKSLLLREITLLKTAAPYGLWQSSDGNYITVSTEMNELWLYKKDSLKSPYTTFKLLNQGSVEEVSISLNGSLLAASVEKHVNNKEFCGLLEIWDIGTKTSITEISDGKSYVNGLQFINDYLYYGVDNELHRLWLPKGKVGAKRISFFKNLSGYILDDSLTPVEQKAVLIEGESDIKDEWAKLYRITYKLK